MPRYRPLLFGTLPAFSRIFPILSREVHGKPLVYLDSAATTQRPVSVVEAVRKFDLTHNANVHRGVHLLSQEATQAYEGRAREGAAFSERRVCPRDSVCAGHD